AGVLESVDEPGDGTGGEPGPLGQRPGGERPVSHDQAERLEVGGAEPEPLGDRLVEEDHRSAEVVRLVLLGVIVWLAIYRDDSLGRMGREEAWGRMRAFSRTQWRSLLAQAFLLAGAFVVFDVIPEQVITLWVPDDL